MTVPVDRGMDELDLSRSLAKHADLLTATKQKHLTVEVAKIPTLTLLL